MFDVDQSPIAPATKTASAEVAPATAKTQPEVAKTHALFAAADALIDRLLHREDPAALAQLTPDQLADYRQIVADGAKRTPPVTAQAALELARSGRPLTNEDRTAVLDVQAKMASMKFKSLDDHNPNQVQIEISFDGTWNDRDEMAYKTNPALLNQLFDGAPNNSIYEVGIGTSDDTKLVGGASGAGLHERIDDAYNRLVARINEIKSTNPQAEVVLVVTGFSRGATAARAFVNELNKRGVPDLGSKRLDGSFARHLQAPRIGAMMLFDTVASIGVHTGPITGGGLPGQPGVYPNLDGTTFDINIPANAELVLQITARDELRGAFPVNSVLDPDCPDDSRIHQVTLPGVHSDIGGSYANPYSQISLQLALDFLAKAGVHMKPNPNPPINLEDARLRIHESRSDAEIKAQALIGESKGPRKMFPSDNPTR